MKNLLEVILLITKLKTLIMNSKNSKSHGDKQKLHEIRSENARHEKRDSRGRFTASIKKQQTPKNSSKNNMNDREIDIIIVDDGIECGCGM